MRGRLLSALAAGALLLGGATTQAGTLTSATWVTEIKGFTGPMVPIAVPITAVGTSTATSISVSVEVPPFSSGLSVAGALVTLTLSGMQSLTATKSMAAASQGVPGNQLTKAGALTFLEVPLRVGATGLFTAYSVTFVGIPHNITVDFYGWTPHTRALTGLTTKGFTPLPDVIAKGSFNLTANGGGMVSLVSPSRITVVSGYSYKQTASLSTLKLTFVPEPGTLLLLGAAAVALAMRWRRYGNTR